MIERLPPHSIESEQGVLGCILLDAQIAFPICAERLDPDGAQFYDLRHRTLYGVISGMHQKDVPIDLLTTTHAMSERQLLEKIGGISYLNDLISAVPSAANVSYYLDILIEKFIARSIIRVCTEIVSQCYEAANVEQLLAEAELNILAINRIKQSDSPNMKQIVAQAMEKLESDYVRQGKCGGIPTGFVDIDSLTDGVHPGELVVIASYPSVGKSALAMNIAERMMLDGDLTVGVFSLEMTAIELVKRLICSHARVNLRNLRQGFLSQADFPKLTTTAGKLSKARIWFDDTSDLSIYQLGARARRMHQKHQIQCWFVDYIQLLHAQGGGVKKDNREQEVAAISRGLKALAKQTNCPVIALSQLNKDGRTRESQAIAQDADQLWKLEPDTESGDSQTVNVWIEKNRNGPRGKSVPLTFLACYTRFESAAKIDSADYDEI